MPKPVIDGMKVENARLGQTGRILLVGQGFAGFIVLAWVKSSPQKRWTGVARPVIGNPGQFITEVTARFVFAAGVRSPADILVTVINTAGDPPAEPAAHPGVEVP